MRVCHCFFEKIKVEVLFLLRTCMDDLGLEWVYFWGFFCVQNSEIEFDRLIGVDSQIKFVKNIDFRRLRRWLVINLFGQRKIHLMFFCVYHLISIVWVNKVERPEFHLHFQFGFFLIPSKIVLEDITFVFHFPQMRPFFSSTPKLAFLVQKSQYSKKKNFSFPWSSSNNDCWPRHFPSDAYEIRTHWWSLIARSNCSHLLECRPVPDQFPFETSISPKRSQESSFLWTCCDPGLSICSRTQINIPTISEIVYS